MCASMKMQGYPRNFEEQKQTREHNNTIVVDLVPPQYQLSPPHSPPSTGSSLPTTPEKGMLYFFIIYCPEIN